MNAELYLKKAVLPYINNIYEESDEEFDDLLNDEFFEADMLLDIIERFRFLRK